MTQNTKKNSDSPSDATRASLTDSTPLAVPNPSVIAELALDRQLERRFRGCPPVIIERVGIDDTGSCVVTYYKLSNGKTSVSVE